MGRKTRVLFDLEPEWADYNRARVVVIPAPYEGTVTYGRGAARGPRALFEASQQVELYDIYLKREVYKVGIHMVAPLRLPGSVGRAVTAVKNAVSRVLEADRFPVLVGGEHSLTHGSVAACRDKFKSLSVLQLDAHADLRDTYEGTKYSHACVMRRVSDMGIGFVPVGIRSMSGEEADWIRKKRQKVFFAEAIRGGKAWMREAVSMLGRNVYLTLDVDVFDPAVLPGTGTPEPGGLSYTEVVSLCRALARSGRKLVGLDIMELAPIPGEHVSEFLAARLLYHLIGLFVHDKPRKKKGA